ncbi:hypothetical protein Bca101_043825 [Brassica carinata]
MLRKKAQAKRDGKRVMVEESVADIAHKQAPPKRARAPRSTKLRALVLEKGTKDGANEPAPTIRSKAPRKTIEPPPIEQEGANAEEEHSEDDIFGDEVKFLHQAVQHYALQPHLPLVPSDFYKDFGIVGFFVKRLMYYKRWSWTNRDPGAQIGIGGLITPLLAYQGISLGNDAAGPTFLDLQYLKSAHFLSGRFNGRCVYSYLRGTTKVELLLPDYPLTTLTTPGAIRFDISERHLLGPHGALGPMALPRGEKAARKVDQYDQGHSSRATAHLFGPPRYKFDQCTGALPLGPIRQAHVQI